MNNPCEEYVRSVAKIVAAPFVYRFLDKYGKPFESKTHHDYTGKGVPKECFRNASNVILSQTLDDRFCYVEGYAMKPGLIPMEHAFVLDLVDGKVFDPTWPEEGIQYFGAVFHDVFVWDFQDRTGHYGILGNLYRLRLPAVDPHAWVESYVKSGLHALVYSEVM